MEMRNPWGNEHEWNGDWNDSDDEKWTSELRNAHDMDKPKPDGRFFMPFESFVEYFNQYAICLYEDEFILSSFTEELESEFMGCYKFEI